MTTLITGVDIWHHLIQWAIPIAIIAALVQVVDQIISKTKLVGPFTAGGGWCSFQAWAIYFLGGGVLLGSAASGDSPIVNGGLSALVGYAIGIIASIAIFEMGGKLGKLGFWAMPVTLVVLVTVVIFLMIAPWPFAYVPALFVGAGVYFCIFSYMGDKFPEGGTKWGNYIAAAVGELVYCVIGLLAGLLTIQVSGAIGKLWA
ncbi:MAG: hypothetical protein LBR33_10130 [Propionibacteriaceae bacterium]|jgi:hypothetical protein|nr:hypothetical protein [Propionibacteriaceae bacterium]